MMFRRGRGTRAATGPTQLPPGCQPPRWSTAGNPGRGCIGPPATSAVRTGAAQPYGHAVALVLLAAFLTAVVVAVTAVNAAGERLWRVVVGDDGHRRLYVDGQLVRWDGLGAEAWAARYRREHQRRLREQRAMIWRLHLQLTRRLDSVILSPQAAIRLVFGPYADEALRVAACETGQTFSTTAQNGQYLGLFQMGSSERSSYGYGYTPIEQALGAYVYFVVSGRNWGPWECKP